MIILKLEKKLEIKYKKPLSLVLLIIEPLKLNLRLMLWSLKVVPFTKISSVEIVQTFIQEGTLLSMINIKMGDRGLIQTASPAVFQNHLGISWSLLRKTKA